MWIVTLPTAYAEGRSGIHVYAVRVHTATEAVDVALRRARTREAEVRRRGGVLIGDATVSEFRHECAAEAWAGEEMQVPGPRDPHGPSQSVISSRGHQLS
ncbi:hypothetical protein [Streptomyces sp. NPDC058989]|uniref:hypothetical protein n=1 Tax=Streptomyces sp. NPDC058989 TaxID=3346686 RepID=UPI0036C06B2A